MMNCITTEYNISKQTLRRYLCRYLVYQDIAALAPAVRESKQELTQDQKNMRWALNRIKAKEARTTHLIMHIFFQIPVILDELNDKISNLALLRGKALLKGLPEQADEISGRTSQMVF